MSPLFRLPFRSDPGMILHVIAFLLAITPLWPQAQFHVERDKVFASEGDVVSSEIKLFPAKKEAGRIFVQPLSFPGARTVQFHFRVVQAAPGWRIRFVDRKGREMWSVSSDTVGTDFWSDEIKVADAQLELWSDVADNQVQIIVPEVLRNDHKFVPQAIINQMPVPITGQSPEIQKWGKAVARLKIAGNDKKGWYCTGFLVDTNVLMTNRHCVHSESEMQSAILYFDYDGKTTPVKSNLLEQLQCDEGLDFALFRVSAISQRPSLKLANIRDLSDVPKLLLIEHPGGEVKKVSIAGCIVRGVHLTGLSDQQTDFGHRCDTLGGSSGSPVMNLISGEVVGLHHEGTIGTDPQLANQAVYMGLILDKMRDTTDASNRQCSFQPHH